MTRPARFAAALVLLSVLAGWLLWVAITTDFDEQAVLVLSCLLLLVALALPWIPRKQALRAGLVVVLIAAMVGLGVRAQAASVDQQRVRHAITQNIIEHAGRALHHDHPYPDVDWNGLRTVLTDSGAWQPLVLIHDKSDRVERYEGVPRKDAWGCKFEYRKVGDAGFRLRSSGPDRRWDTPDDIVIEQDTSLPNEPRPLPESPRRWFDPNRG